MKILSNIFLHKRWGLLVHLLTTAYLVLLLVRVIVYYFLFINRNLLFIAKVLIMCAACMYGWRDEIVHVGLCLLYMIVILLMEILKQVEKK